MATLQEIAAAAGVTDVTVSRVLGGRYIARRADAVRRANRIRRIAMDMGYRPDAAARATRTGRTGLVGMIRSSLHPLSVHHPDFDRGLDEALHERGLCLVRDIIDQGPQGEPASTAPRIVREKVVDGLLINYAFGTTPAVRDYLDRCEIPSVWINRKRETNCVRPDDEGAAYQATCHLLTHGHQRIGYVGAPVQRPWRGRLERHYSDQDRAAGYDRAMTEAGLEPMHIEIADPPESQEDQDNRLLNASIALLRQTPRPTAIVCSGGRTMLHAALHLGLRVPHDISIMSFDEQSGGNREIAVDRVLVPYEAMGRMAVAEICALIDAPQTPRKPVVIPFEFHATGTVGRPPASNGPGHA